MTTEIYKYRISKLQARLTCLEYERIYGKDEQNESDVSVLSEQTSKLNNQLSTFDDKYLSAPSSNMEIDRC